jgi:hypothetical protein
MMLRMSTLSNCLGEAAGLNSQAWSRKTNARRKICQPRRWTARDASQLREPALVTPSLAPVRCASPPVGSGFSRISGIFRSRAAAARDTDTPARNRKNGAAKPARTRA